MYYLDKSLLIDFLSVFYIRWIYCIGSTFNPALGFTKPIFTALNLDVFRCNFMLPLFETKINTKIFFLY